MTRLVCCLLLWFILAFAGGLSVFAQSTRIATYNLRNYLLMDRHVEGVWRPAYPKPEAEKAKVREVIKAAYPDVLALQEIGAAPFLRELRADLALEGSDYPYAIHMSGADDQRHLAVLSKLPPIEVVKHQDLSFSYLGRREGARRGMLEVSLLQSNGLLFKLFVVHLKSRWSDEPADPESQLCRTREAEACRNRIIERTLEMGVFDFLVAGDFNDHPGSAPMRRFYRRGDLEIGARVPAWDSRKELWTYFYKKEAVYSLVDGFVVSNRFSARVLGGCGTVVDLSGVLEGSDHRMVYVDLAGLRNEPATASLQ
jgi:endonuclease/exonuclease/phosphatase family metal-dependent hydrolase